MIFNRKKNLKKKVQSNDLSISSQIHVPDLDSFDGKIGIVAGNSDFPIIHAKHSQKKGLKVFSVAHIGETKKELEDLSEKLCWIKVGELSKLIKFFKTNQVKKVVFAGGISRIDNLSDVKLDAKAAAMMLKIRSTKDDHIMRGIANELLKEGIEVISCLTFIEDNIVSKDFHFGPKLSQQQLEDIDLGRETINALSALHVGQLVTVKNGVVIAIEAIEGSDSAIKRTGELSKKDAVIVKCAKKQQDMRFDVPTIGPRTIDRMIEAKAKVLALEEERCIILEKDEVLNKAKKAKITIVSCKKLSS